LTLPPLRERPSDIREIAESCIEQLNERYALGPRRLSDELLARLQAHEWPGNVRQLRAVIESMYVMSQRDLLEVEDLPVDFAAAEPLPAPAVYPQETIAGLERAAIVRELGRLGGNRSRVARALGISRSTLYRKLVEYGIE
jgi:DNA-binding NtrC family response regulator